MSLMSDRIIERAGYVAELEDALLTLDREKAALLRVLADKNIIIHEKDTEIDALRARLANLEGAADDPA